MTVTTRDWSRLAMPGLFVVALAMLAYEVALARVIAIQHWFHLAQLVIAVALLGFGCAGVVATLWSDQLRRRPRDWLAASALLLSVSIALGPVLAQKLPLNMLALPWQNREAFHLLLYGLVFFPAFLTGGLFVTICFLLWPERAGRVYAFDLLGSALGALGILFVIRTLGLETSLLLLALLPLAVAIVMGWGRGGIMILCALVAVMAVAVHMPFTVKPSPDKAMAARLLEEGSRIEHQTDGLLHRLSVLSGPGLHAAPGLSLGTARRAPSQWQLFLDGDSPIPLLRKDPEPALIEETLGYAPYLLAPERPRVLLLDVASLWLAWAADTADADSIRALSADPDLIALLERLRDKSGDGIYPGGMELHNSSARRYLESSDSEYDLVILQLTIPEAGIAAPQEDFLLTVQGLEAAFKHLPPDGILAAHIRFHTLPRESLRLLNLVTHTLRAHGLEPDRHTAMIRDWRSGVILAGRSAFKREQVKALTDWAERRQFDLVTVPGVDARELPEFHQTQVDLRRPVNRVLGPESESFKADYLFDIHATSDNRPFFYRFFRWQSLERLREIGGSQWRQHMEWGYLLGFAALLGGGLVAAILLGLPFALARQRPRLRGSALPFGYFMGIGLGFMLIEIALLQKAALLLDATALAMSTIIAATLAGAGIGSACQQFRRPGRAVMYGTFAVIALAVAVALPLLSFLFAHSAGWSLAARMALVVAVIALVAVPMGIPLPYAINQLRSRPSATIAWAWAVNGFASVLGTLAAGIIAIHWGLYAVMLAGIACYGLAAACLHGFSAGEPLPKSQPRG